jgi:hypothetical protein
MKRARVIGTTDVAISQEETSLDRALPKSFRAWLIENNGLDIEGVHVYPVKDERDAHKTWESIYHNYINGWSTWLRNHDEEEIDFSHLLPFADYGTGDYYCFDYSHLKENGEYPIVKWSHETGETELRASCFTEFVRKVLAGKFDED